MKTLLVLSSLLIARCAFAGFAVPKAVHEGSAIEKATEEAKAANKPVTILVSDKDTTCPICSAASASAIKELKSKSVMVYVKTGETSSLPAAVTSALSGAQGKYLPRVVILDNSLSEVIAAFSYNDDASFKKEIREAEKKMRPAKPAGKTAPAGKTS